MSAIANNATAVPARGRSSRIVCTQDDNQFTEKIPISAGI